MIKKKTKLSTAFYFLNFFFNPWMGKNKCEKTRHQWGSPFPHLLMVHTALVLTFSSCSFAPRNIRLQTYLTPPKNNTKLPVKKETLQSFSNVHRYTT